MVTDNDKNVKDSDTVAEAARDAAQQLDAGVADDVSKFVNESLDTMQRMANEYYQRMEELAGQAADQAGKIYEDGQDYARRHPGVTLTGAFAFGVLIGVLIRNN